MGHLGLRAYSPRKTSVGPQLFAMPRGVLKENLPEKVCVSCGRPFTWRKKWERCWDEVTTCSKSCNAKRREVGKPPRTARSRDGSPLPPPQAGNADVEDDDDDDDDAALDGLEDLALAPPQPQKTKGRAAEKAGAAAALPLAPTVAVTAEAPTEEDRAALTLATSPGDNDAEGEESDDLPPGFGEWRSKKAQKKDAKAAQRAKREGTAGEDVGRKSCDLCARRVDLLVRCTVDAAQKWKMVCGSCWRDVSGGVPDGDAAHPHYKYGGLWKNRSRSVA